MTDRGKNRIGVLRWVVAATLLPCAMAAGDDFSATPFGKAHPQLDRWVTGEWWTEPWNKPGPEGKQPARPPFALEVSRDEVVAFALYTVDVKPAGGPAVLKLTAQLFPLKPGEPRVARLEVKRNDAWEEVATSEVLYPGWDAHFRVEGWDQTKPVSYRVRHGERASFAGLVRADPAAGERITVAVLSCNSSRTPGERQELMAGLRAAVRPSGSTGPSRRFFSRREEFPLECPNCGGDIRLIAFRLLDACETIPGVRTRGTLRLLRTSCPRTRADPEDPHASRRTARASSALSCPRPARRLGRARAAP